MLEEILKQIISEKKQQGIAKNLILNFLKEYIQILTLDLLYNHKDYKRLVFKGGSCLRICFGTPRLSEDLDFDYEKKQFNNSLLKEAEKYLSYEIKNKYFPSLETKLQEARRLYLKFPFLYRLGLARKPESDKLYVKIETNNKTLPDANFDLSPISKFGFNFIAYHYDLPSLMTGKINALLKRLWFKGKRQEIDIKGRDFYDLFWFLQKGVKPNWKMLKKLTNIADEKKLKKTLLLRVEKAVTPQKLSYDLKNFIADKGFVEDFSKNYLKIIKKYLTSKVSSRSHSRSG